MIEWTPIVLLAVDWLRRHRKSQATQLVDWVRVAFEWALEQTGADRDRVVARRQFDFALELGSHAAGKNLSTAQRRRAADLFDALWSQHERKLRDTWRAQLELASKTGARFADALMKKGGADTRAMRELNRELERRWPK